MLKYAPVEVCRTPEIQELIYAITDKDMELLLIKVSTILDKKPLVLS